jgi:hypothetical protein
MFVGGCKPERVLPTKRRVLTCQEDTKHDPREMCNLLHSPLASNPDLPRQSPHYERSPLTFHHMTRRARFASRLNANASPCNTDTHTNKEHVSPLLWLKVVLTAPRHKARMHLLCRVSTHGTLEPSLPARHTPAAAQICQPIGLGYSPHPPPLPTTTTSPPHPPLSPALCTGPGCNPISALPASSQ